jgi:pimeloyl-ACP methyl ester carboxylesterase
MVKTGSTRNGSPPMTTTSGSASPDVPTPAASERYRRKTVDLARRCGKVSGWLLPHISTADTARDLDHLRRLVGDRKLTYVGLSYGTYLGQTYANMFPGRVRAMLIDSVVDPVPYSKGAEARVAGQASGADNVFAQLLALCENAGPQRCALAGGGQTAAERVDQLFARVRRAPIPAPAASPPGELTYAELLVSQFNPLRIPEIWPDDAKDLDAAVRGDGSALATKARQLVTPAGFAGATTSAAISCADAPARRSSHAWPQVIERFTRIDRLYGPLLGWWLWAPCASWPVRGQDNYRGPWNKPTKTPILVIGLRQDPATPYVNAVRSARRLETPSCSPKTATATSASTIPAPASTGRGSPTWSGWLRRRRAPSAGRRRSPSIRASAPELPEPADQALRRLT